jgi:hypothetical protein
MNQRISVAGHADPTKGAAHDATGQRIRQGGSGYARCACGALSPEALPSQVLRRRWHRMHREVLAGVPWAS